MQDDTAFGAGEEAFRLIVETIPGLIAVMTATGELEHVNGRVLEYFGRTLEELKRWGSTDAVHPDDRATAVSAWQHAVRITAEVAAALAAAHARGIVHRDVTPANVMLTQTGAKVVDFGISALIGENDIDPDGSLLGTPAYLAP